MTRSHLSHLIDDVVYAAQAISPDHVVVQRLRLTGILTTKAGDFAVLGHGVFGPINVPVNQVCPNKWDAGTCMINAMDAATPKPAPELAPPPVPEPRALTAAETFETEAPTHDTTRIDPTVPF